MLKVGNAYKDKNGICVFRNWICITSMTTYISTGIGRMPVMTDSYSSWKSTYMMGAKYYSRKFSKTDCKPVCGREELKNEDG